MNSQLELLRSDTRGHDAISAADQTRLQTHIFHFAIVFFRSSVSIMIAIRGRELRARRWNRIVAVNFTSHSFCHIFRIRSWYAYPVLERAT